MTEDNNKTKKPRAKKGSHGEKIREIRKTLGLTLKELSEKLDVSYFTIKSWEINQSEPSIQFLKLLHEKLNVNIHWLISNSENMFVKTDTALSEFISSRYNCDDKDIKIIKTLLETIHETNEHKNTH